jgi:hypothetical protein
VLFFLETTRVPFFFFFFKNNLIYKTRLRQVLNAQNTFLKKVRSTLMLILFCRNGVGGKLRIKELKTSKLKMEKNHFVSFALELKAPRLSLQEGFTFPWQVLVPSDQGHCVPVIVI